MIHNNSTKYKKIKMLGKGSFGKVYLVRNMINDQDFVMKEIYIGDMEEKNVLQMFLEAKILEVLRHPNIIKLNEFYKTESQKLILIFEYAQ